MKIKMTYVIVMMNSDDDDVNIDKRVELFRIRHMTVIMKGYFFKHLQSHFISSSH